MLSNLYLRDILSQGQALAEALPRFDLSSLQPFAGRLSAGAYDRLILTGMGASYYAAYPASLQLARTGRPVLWLDAAELIHYAQDLLTPHSLVWIASQSGRSAEIVALLELARRRGVEAILATTNEPASPLAAAAGLTLLIQAEPEQAPSTRSYLNSLAQMQLAAAELAGEDPTPIYRQLEQAADAIQAYTQGWQTHLEAIAARLGLPRHLAVVGRGPSLASALCGALIFGEAAKFPALALNAAQFRHGPLEMSGSGLGVLVLAGPASTAGLNYRLLQDLLHNGASAWWLAPTCPADLPAEHWLPVPDAPGAGLPLAEMLPLHLIAVHLAQATGFEPGKFLYSGKVTFSE